MEHLAKKETEVRLTEEMQSQLSSIIQRFDESTNKVLQEKKELYDKMLDLKVEHSDKLRNQKEKHRKHLKQEGENFDSKLEQIHQDYRNDLKKFMEEVSNKYQTQLEEITHKKNEFIPIISRMIFSVDKSQRDYFIKNNFPLNAKDIISELDQIPAEELKSLEQRWRSISNNDHSQQSEKPETTSYTTSK